MGHALPIPFTRGLLLPLFAVISWVTLLIALVLLAVSSADASPILVAGTGEQTSPFRWN